MKKLALLSAAGLLALIGAATHASAQNIDTDFTTSEGYTTGSINNQTGASGFTTSSPFSLQTTYNQAGDIVVNPVSGTATASGVNGGFTAQNGPNAQYNGSVTAPVDVSASFTLGSGDFDDSSYGGYGPEIYTGTFGSQVLSLQIYSQSNGGYQLIGSGFQTGFAAGTISTTDTLQFNIDESTTGTGFTLSLVDLTTDTVLASHVNTTYKDPTTAQTGGFATGYDPTVAFSNFMFEDAAGPVVPEPSSVALMLLGLGGVAATLRLRRRSV